MSRRQFVLRVALHTPFVLQKNTGITRYIFGLLHALSRVDNETEYACFWPPQAPWPDGLGPNFSPVYLTIGTGGGADNPMKRILRENRWMAKVYQRRPFDVLHSPFGYLPLRSPAPAVLTVPDLRVLRYPKTFSRVRGAFLRWAVPRSVRQASLTLAMSEATRQEILNLIPGASAERVRVAYPGLDARWFTPVGDARIAAVRDRLNLPARFALAVSTREPHKNLPRLLEAFARVRRETPALSDLALVLVGATFSTGTSDDIGRVVQHLGIADAVHAPGVVPDEDLPAVYAAASVLCFPSLYEGFGYPPLEAMAVGTPVVTSNVSCMPEVSGEAAELADPLSKESIAEGIRRVLMDDGRRSELITLGHALAARYNWDRHALQLIAAYRDVAAASSSGRPDSAASS